MKKIAKLQKEINKKFHKIAKLDGWGILNN